MMGLKIVERFRPVGRLGGGSGGTGGRKPPVCAAEIADRLNGARSPNMFSDPWAAPRNPPSPADSAGAAFSASLKAFAAASGDVGEVEGVVVPDGVEGSAPSGMVEGFSGAGSPGTGGGTVGDGYGYAGAPYG